MYVANYYNIPISFLQWVKVNIIHNQCTQFLFQDNQYWEDSAMMLARSTNSKKEEEMTELTNNKNEHKKRNKKKITNEERGRKDRNKMEKFRGMNFLGKKASPAMTFTVHNSFVSPNAKWWI